MRLNRIDKELAIFLREYPSAIQAAGVNALILGEISLAGPTVAELLKLPYCVISTSIPHNFGWDAPASYCPSSSRQAQRLASLMQVSIFHMKGPVRRILDRHRAQMGMESIRNISKSFPELAHITQWPQCLDTPHAELPKNFFYTGPFVDEFSRVQIDFPWNSLDGRPLVYASLGTTAKANLSIYSRIAEACAGLDLQLVITLGGRRDVLSQETLPGNPLLVQNAPQLELLKRAALVITHAGPNTVLETLLQGKPMLAFPLALDQPAVAARLARLGVAEVLSLERHSVQDIRQAVIKVLREESYRNAAQRIQQQLISLRGVLSAADRIEAALAR